VKRFEDGNRLCDDIVQMIIERAELEKAYSKSLKEWSNKWNDNLQKSNEFGTIKRAWTSSLNEADRLSEIHMITHNNLYDELKTDIKDWQKQNYPKSKTNQLIKAKHFEEEFKKVIKNYEVFSKSNKDRFVVVFQGN
jgi:hypothetical protein